VVQEMSELGFVRFIGFMGNGICASLSLRAFVVQRKAQVLELKKI